MAEPAYKEVSGEIERLAGNLTRPEAHCADAPQPDGAAAAYADRQCPLARGLVGRYQ